MTGTGHTALPNASSSLQAHAPSLFPSSNWGQGACIPAKMRYLASTGSFLLWDSWQLSRLTSRLGKAHWHPSVTVLLSSLPPREVLCLWDKPSFPAWPAHQGRGQPPRLYQEKQPGGFL